MRLKIDLKIDPEVKDYPLFCLVIFLFGDLVILLSHCFVGLESTLNSFL